MTHPRAAASSIAWNYVGKGLEYILQYATSLLIARALGLEGNGEVAGLISFAQLVLVLGSFGLETSLNRHIPLLNDQVSSAQARYLLRRFALLRLSLIGLLLVAGWIVVSSYPGLWPLRVKQYALLLLILTLSRSLSALWAMALTARLETRTTGMINVATRIFEFLAVAAISVRDPSVGSMLGVLAFSSLLQCLAYLALPALSLAGKTRRMPIGTMVIFGGAFWGNTVVDYFLGRHGDIAFLSVLLPDTGQASLYDVAFSVVQMGAVGMTIGLSGISLALASRIASESVRRLDLFTMTVVRFVSLLTIPLYAFLYWNIPLVLSVLYPASFNGAAAFVQGMVIFRLVSRLFGGGENADYLLARGKVVPLVLIGLLSASTNVLLDILLIPSLGARGAVIASGVANLTVNGLSAFLVMRRSSVSLQFVSWSLLVAASLLAAFVVSIPSTLENELGLLLRLTGFTALMVLGGLIVRPMTRLDLELLGRVDERMLPIVAPFVRKNRGGAFL